MGWKNEKGEHMEWTTQNTKVFIEIVHDRVKKKQLHGSTFEIAINIWEDINNQLKNITGQDFGMDRVKNRFERLRIQHLDFLKGDVWNYKYNKKGLVRKKFKKRGLEHDHIMLGEIFNHAEETKKLGKASIQDQPTTDEGVFLSKPVQINHDVADVVVVGENMQEIDKKRKSIGSSSEQQCKEAKISTLEKLEASLSKESESTSVKAEASKAKVEGFKREESQAATSLLTDPYSIDACMEVLDSMEDVSTRSYNNALVKFMDKDWRLMFIKMPSFRRKGWLASLE